MVCSKEVAVGTGKSGLIRDTWKRELHMLILHLILALRLRSDAYVDKLNVE